MAAWPANRARAGSWPYTIYNKEQKNLFTFHIRIDLQIEANHSQIELKSNNGCSATTTSASRRDLCMRRAGQEELPRPP
jgi:hypothetical protein